MAAKRNEKAPPGPPGVDPATGCRLIEAQISRGRQLLSSGSPSKDSIGQWELVTRNILEKAFGVNSPNVSSVMDVGKYGAFVLGAGEAYWESHRTESLTTQLARLEGLVELLRTEEELQGAGVIAGAARSNASGHRVFLVHGRDEAALQGVARFLEKLDQEVVLLREQPNRGQTIIEKFEEYSDVGFAVVLLTGDDRGGLGTATAESLAPRARQNVILELGFFLGRLGRSRVCALFVDGVEIPSDYSGVLYVRLDPDGAWRLHLAKELRAAGLSVDMNKAF